MPKASFLSIGVPWLPTVTCAGLSVSAVLALGSPPGLVLACASHELLSRDFWLDVSEEHEDNREWCLLLLVGVLRVFDDDDDILPAIQVFPVDRTLGCLSSG